MTKRELIQMALDSLVSRCGTNAEEQKILIPMLRAELEKPEPEPVAWWNGEYLHSVLSITKSAPWIGIYGNGIPLYRKEDI